jgi:hypothetical protein
VPERVAVRANITLHKDFSRELRGLLVLRMRSLIGERGLGLSSLAETRVR